MSLAAKLKAVRWLRVIGIWEMVGGVWGLLVLLQSVPMLREKGDSPIIIGLFFGFSAASFAAGMNLIRGEPFGRKLSLIVQGMQILNLRSLAIGWQAILGPFALLWWDGASGVGLQLGATAQLFFASPDRVTLIALTLIACVFFLLLVDAPRGVTTASEPGAADRSLGASP